MKLDAAAFPKLMAAHDKEAAAGVMASLPIDPTPETVESETILHNGNMIGKLVSTIKNVSLTNT